MVPQWRKIRRSICPWFLCRPADRALGILLRTLRAEAGPPRIRTPQHPQRPKHLRVLRVRGFFCGLGCWCLPRPRASLGPKRAGLGHLNHRIETLTQTNERAQRGRVSKHWETCFACRVHWGPEVSVVLSPLYTGWRGWNHVALQMCMKARSGEDVPCPTPGSTLITPSCASSRAMSPNTIFDRCSGEWALGSHRTAPSS